MFLQNWRTASMAQLGQWYVPVLCNFFSCYGIGIGARLNAGREEVERAVRGERWDEIRAAKTRETEALHWMTEVLLKVVSHSLISHDMQQQIWCSLFKRLWKPFLPLQLILVIKEFFHLNSWDSWYFLCVYSQVLRLERYNPHGHYKFHRTD